ncbi:unnamed protein product [Cyclocybe aegerita]|uniref:CCHC-type domain-containing protein n=1 Tax=Cyclocybe aegerita TaxID=1973307 RepID=A0A8S0WVF8_CYCAE|nr:unnamed protein product [Cyclocybe aegerita]
MAYQFSRKGCFKCGNLGHIAENCSSEQRLCYNCRQPGHESSACPSPRTVAAKQCYSCGGVGHIQAECPSLRIQQQAGNQKCYNCGRFGHFARNCQNGVGGGFAPRAPAMGRALNTSTLPPVKCYRCGGPNHLARDCLAAPGTTAHDNAPTGPAANINKNKTCYKCQQEGHIARDCPEPVSSSDAKVQLRPLSYSAGSALRRRTLFSLPSLPPLSPFDSRPQTYHEQRLFPYKEKELYAVVADVASYPKFIPFCTGSRTDRSALEQAMREKTVVDAELTVGFLNFTESYTSVVTSIPFKSVQAVAASSTPLFKTLSTTWSFQSHRPAGSASALISSTLVSFDLTYEFANPLHAGVSSAFFGRVSKMMIQAFEDRCKALYGPSS